MDQPALAAGHLSGQEEGRQLVERLVGQAALVERHPEVPPKTTAETSEELDWGGIGAELDN